MTVRSIFQFALLVCVFWCFAVFNPAFSQQDYQIDRRDDIAQVWSGHPVGFCLKSYKGKQFVGFYDAERNMTIGMRDRDAENWTFQKLDTKVGWDSHNSITMAFDRDDVLHIAGNMHLPFPILSGQF